MSDNAFTRFFDGRFGAARAYILSKVLLTMLAFDTFMLMLGHAGRYGVDGFNVAHFAWLDRIQPLPTAPIYVAVLLLTGLLSLTLVLTGLHPWAMGVLTLLYTYSWAMSMHDSFQHHYFVSILLACMTFFPRVSAKDLFAPADPTPAKAKKKHKPAPKPHAPQLTSGVGFPMLGASICIVYMYTAIAKLDPQWLAGHTIRKISQAEKVYGWLQAYASRFGVEGERFWSLLSTWVIPLEMLLALGYLFAVRRDESPTRLGKAMTWLALSQALLLHLGAEAMDLEIGWFSYYMMALGAAFLLPLRVIDGLALAIAFPARACDAWLKEAEAENHALAAVIAGLLLVAGLLGYVGVLIDLPGALAACVIAAVAVIALSGVGLARGQGASALRPVFAGLVAATAMWLAIANSDVRWDFYRYLGGDLQRRNQPERALETYEHGERYAPAGETRRDKISQLKRQLGR